MTKPHSSLLKQAELLAKENPDALVTMINVRGEFQYVSPNSQRLVGYTAAEALGRPFSEFVHPGDVAALYLASQTALLNEKSPDVNMRTIHKDGHEIPMRGYAIKLLDPATGDPYLLSLGFLRESR